MARKKEKEIEVNITDGDSPAEGTSSPEPEIIEDENSTEEASKEEVAELSEEDALRQKVIELEDRVLRSAAEFDNYKKRMVRQFDEMSRAAESRVLRDLLEVIDNFDRALKHSDENGEDADLGSFKEGTRLIFAQLNELLKRYDVCPIEAIGQPFDPNLHEAMMQIESDDYDDGIISLEIAKGYRQGERVLRHSKVGVSTGSRKSGSAEKEKKE